MMLINVNYGVRGFVVILSIGENVQIIYVFCFLVGVRVLDFIVKNYFRVGSDIFEGYVNLMGRVLGFFRRLGCWVDYLVSFFQQ